MRIIIEIEGAEAKVAAQKGPTEAAPASPGAIGPGAHDAGPAPDFDTALAGVPPLPMQSARLTAPTGTTVDLSAGAAPASVRGDAAPMNGGGS